MSHGQKLHIVYESWTAVSTRSVAPLGVVVKAGVWYGVALDGERPLTFRLSQIRSIAKTDETFDRPPSFDLARYWTTQASAYERSRFTMSAKIRVSPRGLVRLRRMSATVANAIDAAPGTLDSDGWIELTIPIESYDHAVAELLSPEVQIIEPCELRRRMYEAASIVQSNHERSASG